MLPLLLLGACDRSLGVRDPAEPPLEASATIPAQPIHRLNRLEYDNTVRDLLGTTLRPAETFPPDGEADGFDNNAAALQLTPTLLDAYYAAARTVIADALDDRPAHSVGFAGADIAVVGGYPVGDLWALSGQILEVSAVVPGGGATVTLLAGASQIGPAAAPELSLEVDGVALTTFVVPGTAAALLPTTVQVELTAGPHSFRYVPTNFINDAPANTSNNVLVHSIRVESTEIVPGVGRGLVYVCEPADGDPACPDTIVARFAERAWRRPLLEVEQIELAALLASLVAEGEPVDEAIRLVLRSTLVSPKFLYRSRTTLDVDADGWLDDYTLASRLSYFLWSTMPDERLFAAAERGELSSEEGLRDAVSWMLADPRAAGLEDGFAEQWLSTRLLDNAAPSLVAYPTWDEDLRDAMAEEAKAFFGDFLVNGAPVSDMLAPDFAWRNDRLAEHYGLAPVYSDALVRVPVGTGQRRGILQLSSWLTTHSDAERASPIKRGRWLSDVVLCEPVPPPPAGLVVEPVAPGAGDEGIREALERHRTDPVCASCHSHLDVMGMGFERFDGVARVRPEPALDTLGELPDGTTFEGADELAAILDQEVFVGCVARKLFTYGTGRSVVDADEAALAAIASQVVADGATLPDLLLALVSTPAFRSPGPIDGGAP